MVLLSMDFKGVGDFSEVCQWIYWFLPDCFVGSTADRRWSLLSSFTFILIYFMHYDFG